MIKHSLFIGLNDKITKQQEIDSLTAFKIVVNACKAYYNAVTVREVRGVYTHTSGELTVENSLEIVILFGEDKKTLALCNDLKKILNQESITLEVTEVKSKLI